LPITYPPLSAPPERAVVDQGKTLPGTAHFAQGIQTGGAGADDGNINTKIGHGSLSNS